MKTIESSSGPAKLYQSRFSNRRPQCGRRFDQFIDTSQRILAAASRSKSVAPFHKVAFKDRLNHFHNRRLHRPITNRREPQRTRFIQAGFGNVHATNGLRTICAGLQLIRQLPDTVGKSTFELVHRDMIHTSRPFLPCHLLECHQQILLGKHLVKQSKPFHSYHPREEGRQHAKCPNARFRPEPNGVSCSSLLSRRYYRWLVFRRFGHSSSILLEPFAPPELPGFVANMVPLTPVRGFFASTLRLIVDCSTAVLDVELRL